MGGRSTAATIPPHQSLANQHLVICNYALVYGVLAAMALGRLNARVVSLIEINLRQFPFVVTFTRVRACYDGVPRCVTSAFTASNHGLLRLVTS
jgi:hypothetical protein